MAGGADRIQPRDALGLQGVREARPEAESAAQVGVAILSSPQPFAFEDVDEGMVARPPGATIYAWIQSWNGLLTARVRIVQTNGEHVADVEVHPPEGASVMDECIGIAHALYFSWWRAQSVKP